MTSFLINANLNASECAYFFNQFFCFHCCCFIESGELCSLICLQSIQTNRTKQQHYVTDRQTELICVCIITQVKVLCVFG